jgi:T5SS/PEP-CTERM-associated repeat protein
MSRSIVILSLVVILTISFPARTWAAIASIGDVNPVPPPGGGNITSILRVGNTELGIMHIAGGTGLSQNTDAFVGNNIDAIGYVTLSGVGSNWLLTANSSDMTIGAAGLGTVSLEDFAHVVVPGDTTLGSASTGIGEINIDGLGTIWDADTTVIGESGLGTVNITGGGRFATEGSTLGADATGEGRIVVADVLSQWRVTGGVTVGAAGRGSVSLLDGGMLRTTTASTLGNISSSVGLVEISGVGSLWDAVDESVTVGSAGVGKLHILAGGRASVKGNILLATTAGSRADVWVDGLGSTLTSSVTLNSGAGESQLTISAGAEVTVAAMTWGVTGRLNLQDGRLKVSSQGGFSSSGLVAGSGVIEAPNFINALVSQVRGRVLVAPGEHLRITNTMTNNGLVDLDGGELEIGGVLSSNFDIDARNGAILRVGGNGLNNLNGGQLAITAGEVDVFGSVNNNSGAQILVGNGASAIFHDTITNNGDLVVLSGSTLLAIEQLNLSSNQSIVSLNLTADDVFAEAAPIQAAGNINLAGDLTVTLTGGYQPQVGDVFPLLASTTGLVGNFGDENLPTLAEGLDWQIQRTTNSMALLVVDVAGLPGDFNADGKVDGRDLLLWQRTPSIGDLADWRANYGTESFVAESLVVPEPTYVVSALSIFVVLGVKRVRNYSFS